MQIIKKQIALQIITTSLMILFTLQLSYSQTQYPIAKSIPAKDTYHGIEITDEYRNMEDLKDSSVIKWMSENSNYTDTIINSITNRDSLYKKFKNLDDDLDYYSSILVLKNNLHFYSKYLAKSNKSLICLRQGFKGIEKVVFDIDEYNKKNKTNKVISTYTPNNNGTRIAIALTEGGKEIAEIVFLDIKTNTILPYIIPNTWPSDIGGIRWLEDDSGIIYVHIPNIDNKSEGFIKNTKSVVYKIGDDGAKHKDIFSKENNPEIDIKKEDFPVIIYLSKKQSIIVGSLNGATNYRDTYYAHFNSFNKLNWKPFYKKEDKINTFRISENKEILYITERGNKSLICKTTLDSLNFSASKIIINEIENEIIKSITLIENGFLFTTKKNGVLSKVYQYSNTNNQYKEITLPFISGSLSISKISSDKTDDLWMYLSGWTKSRERYKYNVKTQKFVLEDLNNNEKINLYNDIVVQELEIKTHDGLDLPLTIIHKKNLEKNGQNRTYIDGYGAYANSNSPYFNPYILQWVVDGGVLVYTHVRGGGEKGDSWHKGGFKETKPNSWKDFISSTEFLINEGYTNPEKIAIHGGSAGGILIGRAITERPDLYKAAWIDVGLLNTLRFETTPNGQNNVKEFGTVEVENEFKALLEMDPYHHIKKGVKYPATFITAGMNDSRVIAWVPAKFAAKLQANNDNTNPILFRADINGGHGGAEDIEKSYNHLADMFAFFYWQLGHPDSVLKN